MVISDDRDKTVSAALAAAATLRIVGDRIFRPSPPPGWLVAAQPHGGFERRLCVLDHDKTGLYGPVHSDAVSCVDGGSVPLALLDCSTTLADAAALVGGAVTQRDEDARIDAKVAAMAFPDALNAARYRLLRGHALGVISAREAEEIPPDLSVTAGHVAWLADEYFSGGLASEMATERLRGILSSLEPAADCSYGGFLDACRLAVKTMADPHASLADDLNARSGM